VVKLKKTLRTSCFKAHFHSNVGFLDQNNSSSFRGKCAEVPA
jgi:hypothetical protein